MQRNARPRALVPRTCRCSCRTRVIIRIIQIAFAMAKNIRVESRRSSSFSFSSSTAPNTADSGKRQACRRPAKKTQRSNRLRCHKDKTKLHPLNSKVHKKVRFDENLNKTLHFTLSAVQYIHHVPFQSLHRNM